MNKYETDKYGFGRCIKCNKEKPLKNGYCINCKNNLPDCFKDIFNGFNDNSFKI